MSFLQNWDGQLLQIERALTAALEELSRTPDPQAFGDFLEDQKLIDKAVSDMTVELPKVTIAVKRAEGSGNKLSRAITYWSKQLVAKSKFLAVEFVTYQHRKMWLRLLQTRFANPKGEHPLDLQAKHVVDLAVRKNQLDQIEKDLSVQLSKVLEERKILMRDYEAITTADQNWDASGSFAGRIGNNPDHAKDHPVLKTFERGLRALSLSAVNPREHEWFKVHGKDLEEKSKTLSEQCLELASALAQTELEDASKIGKTLFLEQLEDVTHLNDELNLRYQAIQNQKLPHSRPKIVQKF